MLFSIQEVGGREVLLAEGAIDEQVVSRLDDALIEFRGDEIWLRSPGGDDRASQQVSRILRESRLKTRIPSGWACADACSFIFFGGMSRTVDPGGHLMFRRPVGREAIAAMASEQGLSDQEARALAGEVALGSSLHATQVYDFYIRMGISRMLLSEILYAPAERAQPGNGLWLCLSQAEMERYHVVTPDPMNRSPVISLGTNDK